MQVMPLVVSLAHLITLHHACTARGQVIALGLEYIYYTLTQKPAI